MQNASIYNRGWMEVDTFGGSGMNARFLMQIKIHLSVRLIESAYYGRKYVAI